MSEPTAGPWDIPATGPTAGPTRAPTPVNGATRAVTCPNCGGTVEMRAAGYSVSVACQYCGSILDVANEDVALIERHQQAVADLALPLGSRGWVKGHEFQLVGYVRRSIDGEGWDEYLLFNPYVGYRWLIYEDGEGWSFGTMLTSLPVVRNGRAEYAGISFYSDGETWNAAVDRVVGEFYWRIRIGDRADLANFSGGGATLSCETVQDEVSWTVSEPVGRGEMRGFGRQDREDASMSAAALAAASGQSRFAGGPGNVAEQADAARVEATTGPLARAWLYSRIGAVAAAAMIVVMILFAFGGTSEQTFTYRLQMDGPEKTISFGPLEFPSRVQRVVIETRSDALDNAWIDTDIALVERSSQQTINAYGLVERYSGRDSDGDWTEGSRSGSTKVAAVPAGTYDLVISASARRWPSPGYGEELEVATSVSSGGVFFSNFMLALFLLAIPPLFLLWRAIQGRSK